MLKRAALAGLAILNIAFPALVRAAEYTFSWALPIPQGNAIGGADFQDAATGYAVGPRGTVLVTGDGGQTWTSRELFPDFAADLEDVLVVGPGELIAAGASPGIFHSTDAGASWVPVMNPSFARLIDIERITGSTLSVVGDDGQVLRSTDNGASWSLLSSPGVHDLHEQYWSDAGNGYIVGFLIARRTTNGGQTWLPLTGVADNDNYNEVFFTDANHGVILSDFKIYRSTNGGASWVNEFANPVVYMGNAVVLSPSHFLVVTNVEGAAIFETTNGGDDWQVKFFAGAGGFLDFDRLPDGSIMAVSDEGDVFRSTDDGTTWTNSIFAASGPFRGSIGAIGIGPGGRGAAGTTGVPPTYWFQTLDDGESWSLQPGGPFIAFTSQIDYWDADRALAAGDIGKMWRTINGGLNWTAVTLPNAPANAHTYDVSLPAPGIAFVTVTGQSQSFIYRTTDFGASWEPRSSGIPSAGGLTTVSFLNANTGFAGGYANTAPRMFKTTDGGGSWAPVGVIGLPSYMSDMHWIDEQTGVATLYLPSGGIFRTKNGGASWLNVWPERAFGISFSDALHGGAIAESFSIDGTIAVTEDGGATWNSLVLPATRAGSSITAVADGFWVGGGSNVIMRVTRQDATAVEDGPAGAVGVRNLRVHGSPGQRIEVAFDELHGRGPVDLGVFDVRGRRVATLDQERSAIGGSVTAIWEGRMASGRPAPQGVYFVRLVTHGAAHAVKVVLSR